jgi:DNA transformation protein and related proteins
VGAKGARGKAAGIAAAAALEETLAPLGVRSRSMFGGHGLFKDETMFAIVDSEGRLYLRADASTAMAFEQAGSTQLARMPYWEVPGPIREDDEELREWAATAAEVAVRGQR